MVYCLPFSILLAVAVMVGCGACQSSHGPRAPIYHTVPPSLRIPPTLERLIVLYPKSSDDVSNAYARLEAGAFQLKSVRPSLKILDRQDLHVITAEQKLQLSGAISDDRAIHLGRLLSADGVLLYQIDTPTLRDVVLARIGGHLRPVVLKSRVILIETGEMVYLNVVTVPVDWPRDPDLVDSTRTLLATAIDRGVTQTLADLQHAFQ